MLFKKKTSALRNVVGGKTKSDDTYRELKYTYGYTDAELQKMTPEEREDALVEEESEEIEDLFG